MEHEGLVSVIEMALRTKTTLTRAQCEKIRKENAQRVQAVKSMGRAKEGKRQKGKDKEAGVQKRKGMIQQKEKVVKKDVEKGLKRGIKMLKEIRKYQMSTDLLIRRLPFQRVVQEIVQGI